jgi:lipopolysaccharide export LptBFGC system permease protein LptF
LHCDEQRDNLSRRRAARRVITPFMAAVLCLVFLPIFFGAAFMFGAIHGDITFGGVLGMLTFTGLAGGIVLGMVQMSRGWDGDGA